MFSYFGPRGWLERCHPQYEYRAGQLQMAKAVEAAFREKRHLLVEAGTGTGKTLAYLIPAIASGQRVVISTGTKNLQDQLYYKDVPFLAQHLGRPLRVCYMKGRNNYLCRQKVYDAEKRPILHGLEQVPTSSLKSSQQFANGSGTPRPETAPSWKAYPKTTIYGASWTRGAKPAPVRNALSMSGAFSPRCTPGRWRAIW